MYFLIKFRSIQQEPLLFGVRMRLCVCSSMCTRVLKNFQYKQASQKRAQHTVRLFRRTKSICIVYVYRFGHKANVWANKIRFYTQINRFERLPGSKLHRKITDSRTRSP